MGEDDLLTFVEAAEVCQVGRRFIQDKVQAGEIPVVDLGYKTKRIRRCDLDAWIEEHLVQAPPKVRSRK